METGNKRRTTVLIFVLIFIAILAGAFYFLNQKFHFLADTTGQIEVFGISPEKQLASDMNLSGDGSYQLTMAKNEYEPFIIGLKNISNQSQEVKLSAPSAPGYKFEFLKVGFVNFGYEGIYQRETQSKYYADPLIPLENGTIQIAASSQAFVWVNVFAEKSAEVGTKVVTIPVSESGGFKLTIKQTSTTLPDKSSLSNIINFDNRFAYLAHGYDQLSQEEKTTLVNKYVTDFSDHRVSPTLYSSSTLANLTPTEQVYWDFDDQAADPNVVVDFSRLDIGRLKSSSFRPYNITSYLYNKSTKTLAIGNKSTTSSQKTISCADINSCPKFDLAVKEYFSAWNKYLTDNGVIGDSIYYIGDELDTVSTNYDTVEHLASLIKEVAPNLKIALTYVTGDISVITPMVNKLSSIDIWIPHLSSVLTVDPKTYLPAGKEFWVYDTSTSYRTDTIPEQYRMMPWMAYKYGATGNLYWASNSYLYSAPWYPKYIYPYGTNYLYYPPAQDVDWSGASILNGALAYNNASVKDPTLVRSIRLEMIREGAEDYELIKILEAKKSSTSNGDSLLARAKAVDNILSHGKNYSYKIDSGSGNDGGVSAGNWEVIKCMSSPERYCLYANREVSEPLPGLGLTEAGKATITLNSITPGKYRLDLETYVYTSKWDLTPQKPKGSTFSLKVNGGEEKTYDYYEKTETNSPGWLVNLLSSDSAKNGGLTVREIGNVTIGSDGKLVLEFGTVEEARAAIFGLRLSEIGVEYGAATILTEIKNALDNIGISTSNIDILNLANNQVIGENPYIISLKVKKTSVISKVEFYVDNNLICTSTLPDVERNYSCPWDTSKYHSTVKIILRNMDGTTEEVVRTATVKLPQNYQSPIIITLPQTGEPN